MEMSRRQKVGLQNFGIFVVRFYLKLWYLGPVASYAPYSTLSFLKDVSAYKKLNADLANIVLKKYSNHLRYLGQECASLAFFDPRIPVQEKDKRAAPKNPGRAETKNKFEAKPSEVADVASNGLGFFITEKSLRFFDRFSISSFLELPAS